MSTWGIVAAVVLVLVNAFFVAAEYAVVAIRRTRIDEMVGQGIRSALIVQRIKSNLEGYLTASQLGVTLASLGLGSVGEPAIAHAIEPWFKQHLGAGIGYAAANIVGVAVAFIVITYLHIVFGELGPKWVAIGKPDRIALLTAVPFELFYRLCYPLVRLITASGTMLLKPLGVEPVGENESALSEDEIRRVLSDSQEAHTIPEVAEEITNRAFHFGRGKVRDVMTPPPRSGFSHAGTAAGAKFGTGTANQLRAVSRMPRRPGKRNRARSRPRFNGIGLGYGSQRVVRNLRADRNALRPGLVCAGNQVSGRDAGRFSRRTHGNGNRTG